MTRILFTTFGSFGDLYPYLAVGRVLRARGYPVTIATSASYAGKVGQAGLDFHPIRPDVSLNDSEMLAYVFDQWRGTERIVRMMASVVRESYADTLEAAANADLIVTHPITFAAPLAARKLEKPWISSMLAPISFVSAYDPPVLAPAPWLRRLRIFGHGLFQAIFLLGRKISLPWIRPVIELSDELGLEFGGHPLFEGAHSPLLILALYSPLLGAPQKDWPPRVVITGFPFHDGGFDEPLAMELERFFQAGPAPVVFTLGSSAVGTAGDFYRQSSECVRKLGVRALFLTGDHAQGLTDLSEHVMTWAYAPHEQVFPRVAAIVHQGGIGTTAQALRSGSPMLVVPFSHDQFDNGERIRRLGVGEVLYRSRYSPDTAARLLRRILNEPDYAVSATQVSDAIHKENGAAAAATAIENCL